MPFHKFEPTEEQRQTVELMAAVNRPLDEIAARVINSATGRPIKRDTLSKIFAADIRRGKSTLLVPALQQVKQKVDAGERWAVELALRLSGVLVDGNVPGVTVTNESPRIINIVGVDPKHTSRLEDGPPVTPKKLLEAKIDAAEKHLMPGYEMPADAAVNGHKSPNDSKRRIWVTPIRGAPYWREE